MSGRRDRCQSVTQTPPANSRLALYVSYLERLSAEADADVAPLWAHEDRQVRAIAVAVALREEPRLSALPFALVRNELVIPAFQKMGMPSGRREAWVEALIDDATKCSQHESDRGHIPKAKRPGHPQAKLWPATVFHAAYLDALQNGRGQKDNRHFEAVALRLGPGIDRDHVRRVVKSFRRQLGWADKDLRALLILATLSYAKLLHELDEASPPKGRHARNLGAQKLLLKRRA